MLHFREARRHFGFEHAPQFGRHAGKQNDDVAIGFEPQSRRGAARVGQNRGAFGNHGLTIVDFGHRAAEAAKAFLDATQDFFVAKQFSAEQIGDGFARAVVVGGAEAAGGNDQIGAVERVAKGGAHFVWRVADDGLVGHANAQAVQFIREEKGIRVQAIRSKKFRTDSDDLRIHLEMLYSMRSGMRKSGSQARAGTSELLGRFAGITYARLADGASAYE